MKRLKALLLTGVLAMSMVFGGCTNGGGSTGGDTAPAGGTSSGGTIKVGVVNNPPSESGYREANVKDMEAVFSKENGYDLKTAYSLKNDDQLQAAQGFITEGVDYLLISAAETTGWDEVLKSAKEAGIKFDSLDEIYIHDPEQSFELEKARIQKIEETENDIQLTIKGFKEVFTIKKDSDTGKALAEHQLYVGDTVSGIINLQV